jgi:hypothetical protein
MFGLFALVPVSQSQSPGVPWYVWLLLLIIVIVVVILLQRRSDAKAPPAGESRHGSNREAQPLPEWRRSACAATSRCCAAGRSAGPVPRQLRFGCGETARSALDSAWQTRVAGPPTWYPKLKYRRPKGIK